MPARPPPTAGSRLHSVQCPSPGSVTLSLVAARSAEGDGAAEDRCKGKEQPRRRCKGKIVTINAAERPRGDYEELEGVFTCGFPLHVTDPGPSQLILDIPIAGGAASVAAAQPRVAAAGGGSRTRSQGVNRGSTGTGTGNHAHKMRWFRFPRPAISRTTPVPSTDYLG